MGDSMKMKVQTEITWFILTFSITFAVLYALIETAMLPSTILSIEWALS